VIIHSNALAEFLPASNVRPQIRLWSSAGKNGFERRVFVRVECVDSGGQRRACRGEHFASRSSIYALHLRQRRYAQSGGAPHADMLVTSRNYARAVLGLRADDLTFSVSKLFFAYGLGNGMYFPLRWVHERCLNPERTNVAHVVEMVARHRRPFSSRADSLCRGLAGGGAARPPARIFLPSYVRIAGESVAR